MSSNSHQVVQFLSTALDNFSYIAMFPYMIFMMPVLQLRIKCLQIRREAE